MPKSKLSLTLFTGLVLFALTTLTIGPVSAQKKDSPPPILKEPGKLDAGPLPMGRIAFIGDGAIWIMDTDGKNRQRVCAVMNSRGRLSFAPDNKRIAFSREGKDTNRLPSEEGGSHQLHDVFMVILDSAATNTNWWRRATFTLGGYYAEWSRFDTLIYCQNDVNAGFVDYISPSHQLARVNPNDGHIEYLRKDWQTITTSMIMPSITRDGRKLAYGIVYSSDPNKINLRNFGIKIIDMKDIMLAESKMRQPSPGLGRATAPSWSPDGQWLAYLNNDLSSPGIFMVKHDLSEIRQIFNPSISQQLTAQPVAWSPNSKWITFATADGRIYVIDINGENLRPLTGGGKFSNPAWSN